MTPSPILARHPLGTPWHTLDPFLFCVHHNDAYPKGNEQFGPAASLAGRQIGQDFAGKDGWNMYHGDAVPGFPAHPHRGFETVTLVRRGLIDHSDSLGAAARFGGGDAQWLTAGRGIVHSEMFPMVHRDRDNPLELFQIWLNLPAASKMSAPHFTMFWSENIPQRTYRDAAGKAATVTYVAGAPADDTPALPAPPPDSWASRAEADLAIWTLRLEPGARWTLPAARRAGTRRCLYFFVGDSVIVSGERVSAHGALEVVAGRDLDIVNGDSVSELLMLQGRPIGEPVAQYGPFVMNTRAELERAFADFRRTGFGGWPWPENAPVHRDAKGRFARHADGRIETPATS